MQFIVFDIGNVLLRWDPTALTRRLIPNPARHAAFVAEACSADFLRAMDLARDCREAAEERARAFPEFAQELREYNARWGETILGPIEENARLLQMLRAQGRPVYAISNFAADKFDETRRIYPFLNDFDVAIISGRENLVKPDEEIYKLLFQRSGRAPEDLVFIDDSPANIATARRLGMGGVLYAPQVDLAAALKISF